MSLETMSGEKRKKTTRLNCQLVRKEEEGQDRGEPDILFLDLRTKPNKLEIHLVPRRCGKLSAVKLTMFPALRNKLVVTLAPLVYAAVATSRSDDKHCAPGSKVKFSWLPPKKNHFSADCRGQIWLDKR